MTDSVTTDDLKIDPDRLKIDEVAQKVTHWMRGIQAEFASNGLATHMTDARAGLDLSAVHSPSGRREAEIWVAEDGYVELRYWSPIGASAAEVAATALRALNAITHAPASAPPTPAGECESGEAA